MKHSKTFRPDFVEGKFFHLYNRTNDKGLLFREAEDRYLFLKKFSHYLKPFLTTYAYNLLDTHFHAVIKVKSKEECLNYLRTLDKEELIKAEEGFFNNGDINKLIDAELQRFFASYAQVFNTTHGRHGNLFQHRFCCPEIEDEAHLFQTIVYVHANTDKHGICSFLDYKWSSYPVILNNKPGIVDCQAVLNLFGGREAFEKFHLENVEYYYSCNTGMDMD